MDFMLPFQVPKAEQLIDHRHKILSVGSCFTEHIGNALSDLKFPVMQNPNGILFDPMSVCQSLVSYIQPQLYTADNLFYLNELWHSWHHHSRFSHTHPDQTLQAINRSQQIAHQFLKEADWLIITLGSAFSYRLTKEVMEAEKYQLVLKESDTGVANCHRAPANWFTKHLSSIDAIVASLDNAIHQLFHFNKKLKIIFTVSPVRHIRDGVIDNNRSKARLLEAVHHLVHKFDKLYYFPSYEIVIDILRDYRFYDIDLVHPNYLATDYVLQQFLQSYTSDDTRQLLKEIKKMVIAGKHRSSHPSTEGHQRFLQKHIILATQLQQQYPYLDFGKEIQSFTSQLIAD